MALLENVNHMSLSLWHHLLLTFVNLCAIIRPPTSPFGRNGGILFILLLHVLQVFVPKKRNFRIFSLLFFLSGGRMPLKSKFLLRFWLLWLVWTLLF